MKRSRIRSLAASLHIACRMGVYELVQECKGSLFGVGWLILQPLLMVSIYSFAFSVIMRASYADDIPRSYFGVVLYAGLIQYNLLAQVAVKATSLIRAHTNVIKQMSLPLEILPLALVISQMLTYALCYAIFVVFYGLMTYHLPPHLLAAPFLLLPFYIFCTGLAFLFAALGAFVRDMNFIMQMIVTALLFLSPVFYPLTRVPEPYRDILSHAPLSKAILLQRDLLFRFQWPDLKEWLWQGAAAIIFTMLCWALYNAVKRAFADVV